MSAIVGLMRRKPCRCGDNSDLTTSLLASPLPLDDPAYTHFQDHSSVRIAPGKPQSTPFEFLKEPR